jgi:hypothetical protein
MNPEVLAHVVVGCQILKVYFVQRLEPLFPLPAFHFSEREQGAVHRVALVHGAAIHEGRETGSEFIVLATRLGSHTMRLG